MHIFLLMLGMLCPAMPSVYIDMEHIMSASGWQPEVQPCSNLSMRTYVLSRGWACSLPGGKFECGVAVNKVTTSLGNLALGEFFKNISENACVKETTQYYTAHRIEMTVMHQLLPQVMACHKDNKATKNGEWDVLSDYQKLKICAFINAMGQFQREKDLGNDNHDDILAKMQKAAGAIVVNICEFEDEEAFQKNYQEGEDADHDQMQKTNARFTNRGKLLARARAQVSKKKTGPSAADVVAYFNDLEAKKKIKTTFAKNKVTNADDVTRIEKCYSFLQTNSLSTLYEKLEWSDEHGPTPLSQWGTSRYFLNVVEKDPDIAAYVLKVLEHTIFGPEDPASKLKKEKVLESNKKLQAIMKALVLQYKLMRDLQNCLEKKPLAAPAKMEADFKVLKKCLDFDSFMELSSNSSGVIQNLVLPAQKLYDLNCQIIRQNLYGKFAEAEQNNPSYQKMYNSNLLTELTAPISTMWEDHNVQFMPTEKKVEWKDHETEDALASGDVTLTRSEAKKRVGMADRDGYVKNYVQTGDEVLDKQNMSEFMICRTTYKDAPQNLETKAGS